MVGRGSPDRGRRGMSQGAAPDGGSFLGKERSGPGGGMGGMGVRGSLVFLGMNF